MDITELVKAYKAYVRADEQEKAFACLKHIYGMRPDTEYKFVKDWRDWMRKRVIAGEHPKEFMELIKKCYLLTAREHFEDFCIYTEWDKPIDKRFYLPRQKGLSGIVKELQRLADDELDILGISMPPGTGKTGIAVYFITWLAGRNPDDGILTGSHNSAFLRGLYEECGREMQADGDYLWSDVFPERKIAKTNSMDMKIDIDTPQRFSTLQFTSVGAGNAGKVRAIQLLYCDDLVEGIEEALSRERLDKKYQQYVVDLKQRKQGNCKELHIATRWSVHDVIGRLEEENHGNPRAKFLTLPALDAKDHSNFDYGGNLGFTTRFYVNLRQVYINSGEEASWRALYMNEPIEREGQLYDPESLRRYYELPMDADGGTAQPDAKVAVCDTAEGKGDDTVMPVFYIYGNDHYLVDCVCTDALPEVASEEIAKMLVKYGVHQCQFESNSAGGMFADRVENLVREKAQKAGVRPTHITKKRTTTNKETKIQVNSAWVKENCLFLDRTKLDTKSNYNQFMYKMSAYSIKGKNKHDDVPDALAQYALYTENLDAGKVTVMRRIF